MEVSLTAIVAMSLVLVLCEANQNASKYTIGGFEVLFDGFGFSITEKASAHLVASTTHKQEVWLRAGSQTLHSKSVEGMVKLNLLNVCETTAQVIDTVSQSESNTVTISGYLPGVTHEACHISDVKYTVNITAESPSCLILNVTSSLHGPTEKLIGLQTPSLRLLLSTTEQDKIFGLGVQYSVRNLKGREVPILTSEQGVGRGLEPLTKYLNALRDSGGNWHTTYSSIPHYMTSSMQSLVLENSEYSLFNLKSTEIDVQIFTSTVQARLFFGLTPLDLIEAYTEFAGRMPPLPRWIMERPVIGYEGGTLAVKNLHEKLKASGLVPAAYWLQDWSGLRIDAFGKRLWWNWELDENHYPMWDSLCKNLSEDGTRVMTYINPYLANTVSKDKANFTRDLYKEANEKGFLVLDRDNKPLIQASGSTSFTFGTVDLSNPLAADWYMNIIQDNMLGRQQSGWMADFAEYIPLDANLIGGLGFSIHNLFPQFWVGSSCLFWNE
eukprot:m.292933 g.292933  ORF g.292933 m.292933 type:complete len:496 (+) comp16388_c0_seq10:141-1628(+)